MPISRLYEETVRLIVISSICLEDLNFASALRIPSSFLLLFTASLEKMFALFFSPSPLDKSADFCPATASSLLSSGGSPPTLRQQPPSAFCLTSGVEVLETIGSLILRQLAAAVLQVKWALVWEWQESFLQIARNMGSSYLFYKAFLVKSKACPELQPYRRRFCRFLGEIRGLERILRKMWCGFGDGWCPHALSPGSCKANRAEEAREKFKDEYLRESLLLMETRLAIVSKADGHDALQKAIAYLKLCFQKIEMVKRRFVGKENREEQHRVDIFCNSSVNKEYVYFLEKKLIYKWCHLLLKKLSFNECVDACLKMAGTDLEFLQIILKQMAIFCGNFPQALNSLLQLAHFVASVAWKSTNYCPDTSLTTNLVLLYFSNLKSKRAFKEFGKLVPLLANGVVGRELFASIYSCATQKRKLREKEQRSLVKLLTRILDAMCALDEPLDEDYFVNRALCCEILSKLTVKSCNELAFHYVMAQFAFCPNVDTFKRMQHIWKRQISTEAKMERFEEFLDSHFPAQKHAAVFRNPACAAFVGFDAIAGSAKGHAAVSSPVFERDCEQKTRPCAVFSAFRGDSHAAVDSRGDGLGDRSKRAAGGSICDLTAVRKLLGDSAALKRKSDDGAQNFSPSSNAEGGENKAAEKTERLLKAVECEKMAADGVSAKPTVEGNYTSSLLLKLAALCKTKRFGIFGTLAACNWSSVLREIAKMDIPPLQRVQISLKCRKHTDAIDAVSPVAKDILPPEMSGRAGERALNAKDAYDCVKVMFADSSFFAHSPLFCYTVSKTMMLNLAGLFAGRYGSYRQREECFEARTADLRLLEDPLRVMCFIANDLAKDGQVKGNSVGLADRVVTWEGLRGDLEKMKKMQPFSEDPALLEKFCRLCESVIEAF